jgi:antitoxin component YwqK of YwqJK toxin-antitoxin module
MRTFIILTVLLLLTPLYLYAREYTLGVDAILDIPTDSTFDTQGSPITGIVKSYYENGNIRSVARFEAGKRDGITKIYRENGIIMQEIPFKNGEEEGIMRSYYKSGALRVESLYKNGKAEGIMKTYSEGGELEYEVYCSESGGKISCE